MIGAGVKYDLRAKVCIILWKMVVDLSRFGRTAGLGWGRGHLIDLRMRTSSSSCTEHCNKKCTSKYWHKTHQLCHSGPPARYMCPTGQGSAGDRRSLRSLNEVGERRPLWTRAQPVWCSSLLCCQDQFVKSSPGMVPVLKIHRWMVRTCEHGGLPGKMCSPRLWVAVR